MNVLEQIQILPIEGSIFFKFFRRFDGFNGFPELFDQAVQHLLKLFDETLSPDGILRRVNLRKLLRSFARLEPPFRIESALRRTVDAQKQLGYDPVISSCAEVVHKIAEIRIVQHRLIAIFQQIIRDLLPELLRFHLFQNAKVSGKIQNIGKFPEQIRTEGMNGGDLCQVNPALLRLQMDVFRVLRQPKGKLLCNSGAELRGGLFGEGDHQKVVDVARFFPAEDPTHQSFYNHFGLAGASGCRDQNRAAPALDRKGLRGCQLIRCHCSDPPLPKFSRTDRLIQPFCAALGSRRCQRGRSPDTRTNGRRSGLRRANRDSRRSCLLRSRPPSGRGFGTHSARCSGSGLHPQGSRSGSRLFYGI